MPSQKLSEIPFVPSGISGVNPRKLMGNGKGMKMSNGAVEQASYAELEFWKNPTGVEVKFDRLRFLYIPDHAEHMMVSWLAKRVFEYQQVHANTTKAISKMIMITMGALLPGVLLQDYLIHGASEGMSPIEFGTFGVKCYYGPGQPLERPEIVQPLSIDIRGHTVAIVEDLIDLGMTAKFVQDTLCSPEYGARETIIIAPYRKSASSITAAESITFGIVPHDTWIITPRERVETMIKRVPYWAAQGATKQDCIDNLNAIGYHRYLIDEWFDVAWRRVEK
jgi:hypoxanthine-guanine phosphoribosyltransferase